MRQISIMKLLNLLFIFITFSIHPIFAQKQSLRMSTFLAYQSKYILDLGNGLRSSNKGISKFNIKYDTVNSLSQLTLNYNGNNNFSLDGSYLQYTKGIATYRVGKVDYHWSFSDNTSLILSNNSRPIKSVYLKLENRLEHILLPSKVDWSLEVFNGFTQHSLNGNESMLLGMRAILSPVKGLDFEIIQTSQWGGNEYNNGISSLGAALFFDSNDGSNSNINKMAGFGISYLAPFNKVPFRIYGQAIGEDEAGNLPSCYSYLAGLEWKNANIKHPTIVGIEAIDTRINTTKQGNCGPNTMYNNQTYDYTNYGKTIGAAIDTEGTSLGLNVRSQMSRKLNIEFATKLVVINDNNWSGHRLSSNRQSGNISSIGVSWVKNNFSISGDVYNQTFNLNKADIKSGYGFGLSSLITF
jgi:hypothetical protein